MFLYVYSVFSWPKLASAISWADINGKKEKKMKACFVQSVHVWHVEKQNSEEGSLHRELAGGGHVFLN